MTVEVVAFPDVETAVIAYLKAQLTAYGQSARVATHVPNPRPNRLVRVTRTGGAATDVASEEAQITLESWDLNEGDAFALSRLVRALVWSLPGQTVDGVWFRRCQELSANAYFPDPDTDSPRYQTTVTLTVRGSALT